MLAPGDEPDFDLFKINHSGCESRALYKLSDKDHAVRELFLPPPCKPS